MITEIVYEDTDILVCHKPAGFPTQTAKLGKEDMISELKKYLSEKNGKKDPYLGVIHRLDQPVEGLLVFAKNKKAAAKLTDDLKKGDFNKKYYAVAFNQPIVEEGVLRDFILRDAGTKTAKIVTADIPGAQVAILHYQMAAMMQGCALYAIKIETGRFHQIRAQMAHAGMPLLGDLKYADAATKIYSAHLGIHNVALCACEITFCHPSTGEKMSFSIKPQGEAFLLFLGNKGENRNE